MDDTNYSLAWVSVKGFNCTVRNNYGRYSVLDGFDVSICFIFKLIRNYSKRRAAVSDHFVRNHILFIHSG